MKEKQIVTVNALNTSDFSIQDGTISINATNIQGSGGRDNITFNSSDFNVTETEGSKKVSLNDKASERKLRDIVFEWHEDNFKHYPFNVTNTRKTRGEGEWYIYNTTLSDRFVGELSVYPSTRSFKDITFTKKPIDRYKVPLTNLMVPNFKPSSEFSTTLPEDTKTLKLAVENLEGITIKARARDLRDEDNRYVDLGHLSEATGGMYTTTAERDGYIIINPYIDNLLKYRTISKNFNKMIYPKEKLIPYKAFFAENLFLFLKIEDGTGATKYLRVSPIAEGCTTWLHPYNFYHEIGAIDKLNGKENYLLENLEKTLNTLKFPYSFTYRGFGNGRWENKLRRRNKFIEVYYPGSERRGVDHWNSRYPQWQESLPKPSSTLDKSLDVTYPLLETNDLGAPLDYWETELQSDWMDYTNISSYQDRLIKQEMGDFYIGNNNTFLLKTEIISEEDYNNLNLLSKGEAWDKNVVLTTKTPKVTEETEAYLMLEGLDWYAKAFNLDFTSFCNNWILGNYWDSGNTLYSYFKLYMSEEEAKAYASKENLETAIPFVYLLSINKKGAYSDPEDITIKEIAYVSPDLNAFIDNIEQPLFLLNDE